MLAVVFHTDAVRESNEAPAVFRALDELGIPHRLISAGAWSSRSVLAAYALPPSRIYAVDTDGTRIAALREAGVNGILITQEEDESDDLPLEHRIGSLVEVLEIIREPYTRSALNLRYLFRTVLAWRPGHFKR